MCMILSMGCNYLKFLPLYVTNLIKSGSIGIHIDQHLDLEGLCIETNENFTEMGRVRELGNL